MNEIERDWTVWAARCACPRPNQSDPPREQSRRLGKSDSDLRHGSEDSPSPHPEIKTIAANLSERSERLAGGDARGDSGFQVTNGRTTARRKLESMPSKQDDVDSESNARNLFEPQMRVVDFIQVINASGFGQVLTERNVRRLRRAFPTVDAGRGKINVAEFIAAMCSRRGRRRKTDELSIKDLELLLDAQEYRCALTGEPLTPENLAVDHIVPISEGGSFDAGNSQLVTKCVNRAKHTMSQHQFITLCQQVAESFRDH